LFSRIILITKKYGLKFIYSLLIQKINSMQSFFNNQQTKKDIELLYHNKLDELGIVYEFLKVETSFGDTNIIVTGHADKPPLVLLHGSNGCAPIGIEALIALVKDFRIYAIDIVGQPNLSAGIRPSMQNDDYGQWMFEILSRLNVWNVTLVGISFGGFISWKTLVFDARRISSTFLIAPAGIVNGNPLKAFWKIFLPMKLYKWRKNTKYVHQFLNELFTEEDEFAFAYLSKVFLHFEMDFSSIPLIKKEEAQKIKTPIHIVAADNDLLFPGEKMIQRARQILPSLEDILLLKNSKHVPNQNGNDQITELIKNHSK